MRSQLARSAERYAIVFVAIEMGAVFTILEPRFLTAPNFENMAAAVPASMLAAIGLTIPLASGDFDLSVGPVLGLAGALVVKLNVLAHLNIVAVMALTLLAALAIGVVNRVLVVVWKLNALIATWISVLRDGRMVWSGAGGQITHRQLAALMTGTGEAAVPAGGSCVVKDRDQTGCRVPRLVVRSVDGDRVRQVSLSAESAEIVCVTGLEGTGYDEISYLVFGVGRRDGEIGVDGELRVIKDPADAIQSGIVFVLGNCLSEGIVRGASVRENVTIPALKSLSPAGVVRRPAERVCPLGRATIPSSCQRRGAPDFYPQWRQPAESRGR
ncbi:MAG: hypothetical protein M0008_02805 [Actinomycetota bacterium]|nr:hypothetical protein [Actinomycetota bacterium]